MNKNILISVIVSVYNTASYLRRCLDSVINQTYTNLEIILVNDGSTDNSLDILKEYEKKDKRIIIVDKENGGCGASRNAGLKIAHGEYYAFVDSDDYLDIRMYETMLNSLLNNKAELCITGYIKDVDYKPLDTFVVKETILDNHKLMEELFKDEIVTSHTWRKLYPAKVFKEHEFSTQKVVQDMASDPYFFRQINKAVLIDTPLYIYTTTNQTNLSNKNANSLTSSINRAKAMVKRLEFSDEYYPDLSYILIPKMVNFMMSSYAKITKVDKDKKEELEFVESNLKKYEDRILKANNVSIVYKIIVYSINHNLKLISSLASSYYVSNIDKFSKK